MTGDRQLAWRSIRYPGSVKPFENKAMEMAARTWHGEWWKEGGAAPSGMRSYTIPTQPRLFRGRAMASNGTTATAARQRRQLVPVVDRRDQRRYRPYAWHYQATPGEEWDFDAVQQLMLADVTIDGVRRPVLMQATRTDSSTFWTQDRATDLGKNFTPVTWRAASDLKNRPTIEDPGIRYDQNR